MTEPTRDVERPKPVEILLVEDNEDDILIVQEALEESRIMNVVQVVRDGEQAMAYLFGEGEFAGARLPGLVLLDINMPKKSGFEVLEEMKADPGLRHLPVVMLTVSRRDEDVVRSYESGAVSYVRKPVDFEKLRTIMEQFGLYWTMVSVLPRKDR